MDLGLTNKKVLITGSSRGIGHSTAEAFLREGAEVFVNGRTIAAVDESIRRLRESVPKAKIHAAVGDVGTEEGIAQIVRSAPEVDVLVNNAATFNPAPFAEITRESWLKLFTVNVLSGALLTQHYLPKMIQRNWGRVIFISSESAINIPVEMVDYGMSKTAQLAVARGAAETCKGTQVTVNSVLPGPTRSEGVVTFLEQLGMTEKRFFSEARPSSIAQRFAETREVADFIVFIASERAAMVNGAALRVDGGTVKAVF